jgi:hypothetical protein
VKQILGNMFNFFFVCVRVCFHVLFVRVLSNCVVLFCASFVIGHYAVKLAH